MKNQKNQIVQDQQAAKDTGLENQAAIAIPNDPGLDAEREKAERQSAVNRAMRSFRESLEDADKGTTGHTEWATLCFIAGLVSKQDGMKIKALDCTLSAFHPMRPDKIRKHAAEYASQSAQIVRVLRESASHLSDARYQSIKAWITWIASDGVNVTAKDGVPWILALGVGMGIVKIPQSANKLDSRNYR